MTKSGMTVEFQYDNNGLRTQKKVTQNGVTTTTNYTLHGKLVTHMTVGADELHFFYDAQSRPTKVNFNGTVYTYLHNLQGDIVGIVDGNGTLVVEYNYDAWGKPLSTIGTKASTLGKLNPFRYRGYVYDEETGLYYLRSRYYNPEWERFVNADTAIIADIFLCHSFSYCSNNPITRYDDSGYAWYDFIVDGWNWIGDEIKRQAEIRVQADISFTYTVRDGLESAGNWIASKASSAWGWVRQTASKAWNGTVQLAKKAGNWVANAAKSTWQWMKKTASDAGKLIKKVVTNKYVQGAALTIGGLASVVGGVISLISPEPVVSKAAGAKAVVGGISAIIGGLASIVAGLGDLLS